MKITKSCVVQICILLILLVAAGLRYPGYKSGYPFIQHPDEPHYNFAARRPAIGTDIESLGMKGYPPGIIYINVVCIALFHEEGKLTTDVIPTIRLISITVSLATILLIYLLGKSVYSKGAGLLAAFLWAIALGHGGIRQVCVGRAISGVFLRLVIPPGRRSVEKKLRKHQIHVHLFHNGGDVFQISGRNYVHTGFSIGCLIALWRNYAERTQEFKRHSGQIFIRRNFFRMDCVCISWILERHPCSGMGMEKTHEGRFAVLL
jgi:hypothetical protein